MTHIAVLHLHPIRSPKTLEVLFRLPVSGLLLLLVRVVDGDVEEVAFFVSHLALFYFLGVWPLELDKNPESREVSELSMKSFQGFGVVSSACC